MQLATTLSEDIRFRGNLKFDHTLRINGSFQGTIQSTGELIIGADGKVEADIKTESMQLEGDLTGNVIAGKRISLRRTARMHGDLRCQELEIEAGAKFTGSCIMDNP